MNTKKILAASLVGLASSVHGELVDQQDVQLDQVNRKTNFSCALSIMFEQNNPLDISILTPTQQRILGQLADQVKEKVEMEEAYNPSLLLESLIGKDNDLSGQFSKMWSKTF